MTDMHRVDFFARRMPVGGSTAYVRPKSEAEIRRALAPFVLRSVEPMGLRVLPVDDAVALMVERDRQSRQEIERLTAVIDQVRDRILVGGQSEAIRARWVREALHKAGLLTPAPGVSETPEPEDDHSAERAAHADNFDYEEFGR